MDFFEKLSNVMRSSKEDEGKPRVLVSLGLGQSDTYQAEMLEKTQTRHPGAYIDMQAGQYGAIVLPPELK